MNNNGFGPRSCAAAVEVWSRRSRAMSHFGLLRGLTAMITCLTRPGA
jgi:hypothetical protein